MSRTLAVAAAAAVVAGLGVTAGLIVFGGSRGFEECGATSVAGDAIGGPFTLIDSTGVTVTDAEVITAPTLLYFGYTFCPDACPIDMDRNAIAVDILAEQGIDARQVFVSIDPARDTPDIVGDYAQAFHDRAIGLTGSEEQVAQAAQAYRVFYQKEEGDPDYYLMQHTTFSYLVLPGHGYATFFRQDSPPEEVAATVACYAEAAS